jgi:hypothetical protein
MTIQNKDLNDFLQDLYRSKTMQNDLKKELKNDKKFQPMLDFLLEANDFLSKWDSKQMGERIDLYKKYFKDEGVFKNENMPEPSAKLKKSLQDQHGFLDKDNLSKVVDMVEYQFTQQATITNFIKSQEVEAEPEDRRIDRQKSLGEVSKKVKETHPGMSLDQEREVDLEDFPSPSKEGKPPRKRSKPI